MTFTAETIVGAFTYLWFRYPPKPGSVYVNDDASTSASSTSDPHAVSQQEARYYYAGLPSKPVLVYRTGKEQWSPAKGYQGQARLVELCPVYNHPLEEVWSRDLGPEVVKILDAHKIQFTTIDIVRFRVYQGGAEKGSVGPVTIWIGVSPGSTSATAAHDAAQSILVFLETHQITDVNVEFRESLHRFLHEVGPTLLEPAVELDRLDDVVEYEKELGSEMV